MCMGLAVCESCLCWVASGEGGGTGYEAVSPFEPLEMDLPRGSTRNH